MSAAGAQTARERGARARTSVTDPRCTSVFLPRRCPRCNEAVTHYKDDGCHSVSCPACACSFCYV